jgi:hypothetical protein
MLRLLLPELYEFLEAAG